MHSDPTHSRTFASGEKLDEPSIELAEEPLDPWIVWNLVQDAGSAMVVNTKWCAFPTQNTYFY